MIVPKEEGAMLEEEKTPQEALNKNTVVKKGTGGFKKGVFSKKGGVNPLKNLPGKGWINQPPLGGKWKGSPHSPKRGKPNAGWGPLDPGAGPPA